MDLELVSVGDDSPTQLQLQNQKNQKRVYLFHLFDDLSRKLIRSFLKSPDRIDKRIVPVTKISII